MKRGWQWKCFSALWLCSCEWGQHTSLVFITELSALPSGVIGITLQWSHTQDCHSLIASECLQTCSLLYPGLHLGKDQRSSKRAEETSSVFCLSSRYRWEPTCSSSFILLSLILLCEIQTKGLGEKALLEVSIVYISRLFMMYHVHIWIVDIKHCCALACSLLHISSSIFIILL